MAFGSTPQSQPRPSELYPAYFDSLPSMAGKTVVVTGASRGLGYVTALSVARKGAAVFLVGRSSARADAALDAIRSASTGPAPQLVECDLLNFGSVRKAAAALRECAGEIDALCCNAGIMMQPDEASKDGYDVTIATNVLSHFLLARELLPTLEAAAERSGEARIVSMSSGSGFGAPGLDPAVYEQRGGRLGGGPRGMYERYHQSKLGNLVFTAALDERLRRRNSRVKALACTPGVCATDMFVHVQTLSNPNAVVDLTAVPSPEDGSLAQLKCICDPAVQSGELYGPPGLGGLPVQTPLAPPMVLVDDDAKAKLWEACESAVGAWPL